MFARSLTTIVLMMAATILFNDANASGQTLDPERFDTAQFTEYEKKLNAILKTRRNEEKAFVKAVILKVKTGKLPSKLVETSYQWVRNKRPDTKYPFIYFERVLRLQATKIGFKKEVPTFDYGIYSEQSSSTRNRSSTTTR